MDLVVYTLKKIIKIFKPVKVNNNNTIGVRIIKLVKNLPGIPFFFS